LIGLVRGGALAGTPAVHKTAVVAAITTAVGTPAMLLHLLAAADADRIAAHHSTPFTDIQVIVESITVPCFGLAMATLAIGAASHTPRQLGHRDPRRPRRRRLRARRCHVPAHPTRWTCCSRPQPASPSGRRQPASAYSRAGATTPWPPPPEPLCDRSLASFHACAGFPSGWRTSHCTNSTTNGA
jgi:hypothetical protein